MLEVGVLVAGIRAFPAPAQNHPLVLIGWKIACSQPLPLKLHLRPDVQIEEMLSAIAKGKINHERVLSFLFRSALMIHDMPALAST